MNLLPRFIVIIITDCAFRVTWQIDISKLFIKIYFIFTCILI